MQNERLRTALAFAGCSTLGVGLVIVIAMGVMFNMAFSGMCGNTIWKKVKNPTSGNTAFLFERNCGATTGFSTQISIVDGDRLADDDSGNVMVIDGYHPDIEIQWEGNSRLIVSNLPTISEVFQKAYQHGGVKIEYVEGID